MDGVTTMVNRASWFLTLVFDLAAGAAWAGGPPSVPAPPGSGAGNSPSNPIYSQPAIACGAIGNACPIPSALQGGAPQAIAVSGVTGATNGSTSTSQAILNFASVPVGVVAGQCIYDVTTTAALTNQTVSSFTATTVTLSSNASATVNSGDTISFFPCSLATFDRSASGAQTAIIRIVSLGSGATVSAQRSSDNASWFSANMLRDDGVPASNVNYTANAFCLPVSENYARFSLGAFLGGSISVYVSYSQFPMSAVSGCNGSAPTTSIGATNSSQGVPTVVVSGSASSGVVLKNSAANSYSIAVTCSSACYAMVFNSATIPGDGATTAGIANGNLQDCIPIGAGASATIGGGAIPERFANGISVAISSTACATKTASPVGFITGRIS